MTFRFFDISDETSKNKKSASHQAVTFRESAAKAFEDALRVAIRHGGNVALSVGGNVVVIDARKLKNIIFHHHDRRSIEQEILRYAEIKN